MENEKISFIIPIKKVIEREEDYLIVLDADIQSQQNSNLIGSETKP